MKIITALFLLISTAVYAQSSANLTVSARVLPYAKGTLEKSCTSSGDTTVINMVYHTKSNTTAGVVLRIVTQIETEEYFLNSEPVSPGIEYPIGTIHFGVGQIPAKITIRNAPEDMCNYVQNFQIFIDG